MKIQSVVEIILHALRSSKLPTINDVTSEDPDQVILTTDDEDGAIQRWIIGPNGIRPERIGAGCPPSPRNEVSFKMLKWFKLGQPIPEGSTYIKCGQVKVGERQDFDGMCNETIDVTEEQYLYEVPSDG